MKLRLALTASLLLPVGVGLAATAQEKVKDAADVFTEIMSTPDKGIPQDLLAKAQCVIIVPGLKKGAFIVGGEYGHGVAECRQADGTGWGAPAGVRVEGGSFGFQIGGSSTDVVLLVMNQKGMNRLMGDKFTIGADAAVAAGPVGRTAKAETDVELNAEILSWSRSKGVFAGLSLNGATMRPDEKMNEEFYGKKMTNREILTSHMPPPTGARPLIAELDRYSVSKEGTAAREKR
jgi:lipid-binding SYLF domain-containing protein